MARIRAQSGVAWRLGAANCNIVRRSIIDWRVEGCTGWVLSRSGACPPFRCSRFRERGTAEWSTAIQGASERFTAVLGTLVHRSISDAGIVHGSTGNVGTIHDSTRGRMVHGNTRNVGTVHGTTRDVKTASGRAQVQEGRPRIVS